MPAITYLSKLCTFLSVENQLKRTMHQHSMLVIPAHMTTPLPQTCGHHTPNLNPVDYNLGSHAGDA